MKSLQSFTLVFIALILGCIPADGPPATAPIEDPEPSSASGPPAGSDDSLQPQIAFFEARVASDPEDIVALNRLGNLYLAETRRTGDHSLIPKAEATAKASLDSVPAGQNAGGLLLLAHARAASHQFASARDLIRELISLHSDKPEYLASLADAYVELGDYVNAAAVMEQLAAMPADIATLTRLARWDVLNGRIESVAQRLEGALLLARSESAPDRRVLAWILWQLGENAFNQGDYPSAERWYREGLEVHGESVALLNAMARLLAGGGKFEEAIPIYVKAIEIDPVPFIVAGLADVYELSGDLSRAAETLASVATEDPLDSRHVVLIWADHDMNQDRALDLARADWGQRQDIYTADALAWAALKAGDLAEARSRIADAMKLGTKDAKLFYHAGMIARASGEDVRAAGLLRAALALNQRFDARQSRIARDTLELLRK